ncbi:adenosylmethionine-8-amino-7-oxononanoate aminotransferase [Buchnera aphidicola str. Bp (Baizongia pistaciae)]|uniref:Adenosylmethionine-8-amino-7-oxononanoate aminotransferase n=1 Tax=Buchnera aphidicola subsp. Baizongia pistaciae (strain Bp) TaxID=224915 RepID=BIOA_BUCBP|nr:adenosylmethionine--8-amino-7-oxononanoate transaminase [Buchnera aphidicola]Q89AK4.1 RecName: Full=Adenosylmethionine-8-amino-7-oxononanoate aminotransferase; AltName: Full=7,8-diamino-pelargonic acid aminotransferase; Short=DAPA AT; Short=DAPA aminotransferase; AltName: Full=7,8-diaminononanoate synthase; Short=DANS; AltName: Full=Diaminopelargonic acid synthase [Buchnera aphidicola str. Bp (Baizongia pistaciae)]AAO26998.1 adenosylmethionine-8-amino-7-oxononanoate aminotransferase [Buchnera 
MQKNNLNFDKQHIWHPYASMIQPTPCILVKSAKGIILKLHNGKKLIDGMSSWWSTIHGYNHPRLNNALKNQINKMSHVMFGGITHYPAISLCKKLIEITPNSLTRIFLSDSGSVSIEIAIKMILQYWQSLGKNKVIFLTIKKSYHGDTFAAMSVCDPKNSFHQFYHNFLPINIFADNPKCSFDGLWNKKDIISFKKLIQKHKDVVAAVILEPIVQSVGGMKFYHPNYLKQVRFLCDLYKIPLILDEIATGFGRTGKFFAFEHSNIVPDVLCIGKAITGGTITLSATLTTDKIANVISNSASGCLMHGPTFMGNPLACAAAYENILILQENKWKIQVKNIETCLRTYLFPLKTHYEVYDVRVLGAIGVVECYHYINISMMQNYFVKNNVWIRPFRKLIYLVPAYIIDNASLKKLINVISNALNYENFFMK